MFNKDFDRTLDEIDDCRTIKQARNAMWKSFVGKKCTRNCGSVLKIALLNAPCHGFGDVIFAQKLAKYIKKWYGVTAKIFTTLSDAHVKLGEDPRNLVKPINMKINQCRQFSKLDFGEAANTKYDLYLVAPLVANYSPDIKTVTKSFKYATKSNVFFFSEYNASLQEDYTFPTGVGGDRLGLMMVKPPSVKKLAGLRNPYTLIYIASEDHISRAVPCYMGFMEMIAKKYCKHKKLDVVVPLWIVENLNNNKSGQQLIKKINKYYPCIVIKDKDGSHDLTDTKIGNVFTVRGDILPVDNKKMFSLMKYSLADILLTGDQSLTDALSCCWDKNIFYQIAEWKESLGKELAKELPNKFLKSKKTSCGTLKAVKYKSNYRAFVNKWDFRKLGRPRLDAVILSSLAKRKSKDFEELDNIINNSRTLNSLRKKIEKNYYE
jgi:hypothetical protein